MGVLEILEKQLKKRVADYEPGWKTIEGTHVLFGKEGQIIHGPQGLKKWFAPENNPVRHKRVGERIARLRKQKEEGNGNLNKHLEDRLKRLEEQFTDLEKRMKPKPKRTRGKKELTPEQKQLKEYQAQKKELNQQIKDKKAEIETQKAIYTDRNSSYEDRVKAYGEEKRLNREINSLKNQIAKIDAKATELKNGTSGDKLKLSDLPGYLTKNLTHRKNMEKFISFIKDHHKDADPEVLEAYALMGQLAESKGANPKVVMGDNRGLASKFVIEIPNLNSPTGFKSGELTGGVGTILHEFGHHLDSLIEWDSEGTLSNAVAKKLMFTNIPPKSKAVIDQFNAEYEEKIRKVRRVIVDERDKLREKLKHGEIGVGEYQNKLNELIEQMDKVGGDKARSLCGGGMANFQDIYDALTGGDAQHFKITIYGHGINYYRRSGNRQAEIFANFMTLSVQRPDLIKILEEEQPELIQGCRATLKRILEEGRKANGQ